jgi:ribose transport system substrate-binding protein
MNARRRNNGIADRHFIGAAIAIRRRSEAFDMDTDNQGRQTMAIISMKTPTALMLGAGALALAVGAANAAPLVKDCGKNGSYVIGFSQANNAEPYRQHVNDELTAAAKKVPQFTLQIADGAGNVNTQTSQMDNFITQKVDLILISPFEASPLTPVVARAMKAGIPVIELDRKTVGDPGKDYTAFIGGDNFKIAQEAGKYVADMLLKDGGEVAVLEGLPSSTPAVERLNGFKDGVKANPKIQVVAEQAADWLPDKAQTAFAAMLQAHPNIKAVYASNDMMAAGARLAAKGAGKKDGDIKILGTDGLPGPAGGIRAVAQGEWAATFTYPTGGPQAIDMAKSILLDCAESVPTTVTVPTTAITPDNAKSMMGN